MIQGCQKKGAAAADPSGSLTHWQADSLELDIEELPDVAQRDHSMGCQLPQPHLAHLLWP